MANNMGRIVGWAAAAVIVVAGVITVVAGLAMPVSFGWFAYQPLAESVFAPGDGGIFVSRMTVIGFAVLTVGLLGLAFLAGRHAGARRNIEG